MANGISPNIPQPGLYRVRLERGGAWQACAIVDVTERDPATGELMEDQRIEAFVNESLVAWDRVWPWAAKHPVSQDEYQALLDRVRRGIGANHPPEEQTVLEQADDLVASAEWLTEPAAKIDAVKRAVALAKLLGAEKKAAAQPIKEQLEEVEGPFVEAAANVENVKAMLLADLAAVVPAEGIHGERAKAFWRETQHLEITDATKLPRDLLQPNVAQVEAYLKAGGKLDGAELKTRRTLVVS